MYGVSKGSLDDSTCQLGKSLSTIAWKLIRVKYD
jgi:hypothetical protein